MVISFIKIKSRKERALAKLSVRGHKKAGVIGFCFIMTMDAESGSETPRVF